jgi:hypothetical protein
MAAGGRIRKCMSSMNGRTFAICLALASFLWLLRAMEGEREVSYTFGIELVGAEANTGLQAVLLDSVATANVLLSPWDHLKGRWWRNPNPVTLKVVGLRTPRTEVPSGQLGTEIEARLGTSARVRSISPATLAIDVRKGPASK